MEKNEYKPISIRVAPKEDFILKEVLSRVHEKKRTEFVKEAMFYWDYILRHSTLGTIRLNTDEQNKEVIEGLFPQSYFKKRVEVDMSLKEKFKNIEIKPIRFVISEDEEELQEICSRAVNLDRYIEEAILEWDCLVNTSKVFLSRYIKRKEDATPEWHSVSDLTSVKITNSSNKNTETSKEKTDISKGETKVISNTNTCSQETNAEPPVVTPKLTTEEQTSKNEVNTSDATSNDTTSGTIQPQEEKKISRGRKNNIRF